MDPGEVFSILDDTDDLVGREYEEERKLFDNLSCPRCGSSVVASLDASNPFSESRNVPNYFADCLGCGCRFDPRTGRFLKMGNPR